MHIRRTIWRRFIEVVNGSTALLQHSTFPKWATKNYADAQSLAIRRQTDNRTDSVSLRRLLIELAAQPEAITSERFVQVNCHGNEKIAAHLWPDVADPTGQHVNPAMVQGDLDVLLQTANTVERFATKRVAHWDVDEWTTSVTYEELYRSVDAVGNLLEQYSGLLTGVTQGADPLMPVGWDSIFRQPFESRIDR
jgi:hypothetical protein